MRMSDDLDLASLPDLTQIAADLRAGRRSAETLAEAALAAQDRHAGLNAFKTTAPDQTRERASIADALLDAGTDPGPLAGIPVSVKDLYGVPGMAVFAGTDAALPEDWQRAGPLAQRLLSQMAVVTGKTHTVEFAFGGVGINPHWGAPVNPWSQPGAARVPGGSSSGAGVSLAMGAALLALGTDTAGSVRIPAAVTGQAGLKITHGRWPQDGIVPLSPSLDTPGLLARSVADLAYGFAALDPSGEAEVQPAVLAGLRIGRPDRPFTDDLDPSISAVFDAAMQRIAGAGSGARVVTARLPGAEAVLDIFRQGGLAAPELAAFLQATFPDRIARLDPGVRARVDGAEGVSAVEYLRRKAALAEAGRAAAALFDGGLDLIATPTVAISAPVAAELAEPAAYARANMLMLRNTAVVNLMGLCALTLPIGLDAAGVPVGLQLIAAPMQEARLLAAGRAIEALIGRGRDILGPAPMLHALMPG